MRCASALLLVLLSSLGGAVYAQEKAATKPPPAVAGGLKPAFVYDPKAREKALAKAAEERPTDVIFLEEVVVLAPKDTRRVGEAISWQEQMMAAGRFNNQTGGALLKGSWVGLPGAIGIWKNGNVMSKDAAYSKKPQPTGMELFRLKP